MIDTDGLEERHASNDALGDESCEKIDSPPGGPDANADRDSNKKSRFQDQLPGQTHKRCTQRAADGHLASSSLRSYQQQAGDVDAGDEQQNDRACEQDKEDGSNLAGDGIA